jgi:16S rRNA (uracil1498-N3)-methyltransferase
VSELAAWLKALPSTTAHPAEAPPLRCLLSLADGTRPLAEVVKDVGATRPLLFLSGPEGGLSPEEDALARTHGFVPVTLGLRVLRAETAALAALVLASGG